MILGAAAVLAAVLLSHPFWLPGALRLAVPPLALRLAELHVSFEVERAHAWRLEVRRLGVRAAGPRGALELLTLEHGRVDLAPSALLGLDWLGTIERVRLRGLVLELDLTREGAPGEAREEPFEVPPHLPAIELADAALHLRFGDGGVLAASSLALSLRADGEGRLAARGLRLDLLDERFAARRAELRFAWREAQVLLHSLRVDERDWIGPSRADLTRAHEGELDVRLDVLALGGRAELELALSPGFLDARLAARGLEPARVPAGLLPSALGALDGLLDLRGEARIPLDDPLAGSGGLELSGRGVRIAGQHLDELEASLELREATLLVPGSTISSGANHLRLEGLDLPLDAPDWIAAFRAASGELELALVDPDEWFARLDVDLPAHLRPHLELRARLAGGVLDVQRGSWVAPGAVLHLARGRVDLGEPAHPRIDLDLSVAIDDLEPVLEPWLPGEATGRAAGSVLLRGRWPEISGELELEGTGITVAGALLGSVDLLADLHRERLELRRFLASSPAARLEAAGSLELTSAAGFDPGTGFDPTAVRLGPSRLELDAADLAPLHPALPPGRARGWIEAEGSLSDLRHALELELELLEGPGAARQPLRAATLAASGTARRIEVESLTAEGDFGSLLAAGGVELGPHLQPLAVELDRLELSHEEGDLALRAPTRIELPEGGISIDDLRLSGSSGSLTAGGRLVDGEGRLALRVQELALESVLAPFLADGASPGILNGHLLVELSGGTLALVGEGLVEGARFGPGPPVDLDWRVAQDAGRGELAALLSWPDGALRVRASVPIEPRARDPLAPGDLDVQLELGGGLAGLASILELAGIETSGVLDGRLRLGGPWEAVAVDLELRGELASLRGAGFDLLVEPARIAAAVTLDAGSAEDFVSLAARDRFELAIRGDLGPALDVRALVGAGVGPLWARELALRLTARIDDAGELVRALEAQGLERQLLRTGRVRLEGTVAGTLEAPLLDAEVVLADALVRLGPSLPPLRNVGGTLRWAPREIEIETLTGEVGGAPFVVRGRVERASDLDPYELDLTLVGQDLLLYRERGIQVRADADLALKGFVEEGLSIRGKLTLSDGRFARNLELLSFERDRRPAGARGLELFSLREPPLSNLRFDVEVNSRSPFRIDNNAARGSLRPVLRMRGTGEVPVLVGTIFLDPTRVNLPSGSLRLESGVIRFEEADPFVPRLSLSGGMRLRGYDIQVTIQGPYDAPEVVLSSSPPLSDRALLILVVTGELPPDEAGGLGAASASRSLAIFLARDFLTRWFDDESVDDDESLLDRFEIYTGRDVTRTGSETVEASFRIADRIFRPNDSLSLRGERDVYDEFNYGLRLMFRMR